MVGKDENVVVKTLTSNELKNAAESEGKDLGDLLDKTNLKNYYNGINNIVQLIISVLKIN